MAVPLQNGQAVRRDAIVPDIHTAYGFYERIYLDD
jgi:hypothetical protein